MNHRLFSVILILAMVFCGSSLFFMIKSQAVPRPDPIIIHGAEGTVAYISQGNLLEPLFREPFETSICIYADFSYVTWTTHNDYGISGSADERTDYLKSIGKPLDCVLAVIHNHPTPEGFSPADEQFYRDLKGHGFIGLYGIYYPFKTRDPILWHKEN